MLEPIGLSKEVLGQYKEKLEDKGHEFIAYDNRVQENSKIIKRAEDADVIIVSNLPLSGEVINSCPNLKFISLAFTGFDHIDMEACNENDILVSNSAGYADQAVAELVFGLTINLLREVKKGDKQTREGKTREGLIGNELAGKKFGIIGTGNIGMQVATIADAFDAKLLGYSRTKNEKALELGMEYLSLEELLSESDVVSVHVPLNDATKNLIAEKEIAMMKKNAIFINCARGPIVNSKALAQALNNDNIAGAGIDVFEMEPPITEDHPLLNSKNTIVTPHVGFATEEAFEKRAEIVFNNIYKWFEDKPQNVVNK